MAAVSTTPTFTWGAANGVTSYTIEIATDTNFTTIVLTQAGIAATTFTPGSALAPNTYYWNVTAVNSFGSTPSTELYWEFTAN
jgi:hypothetical protein